MHSLSKQASLLDRVPSSIQPGCITFIIDRAGNQNFKLGKQVYSQLGLCKIQRIDVVVTSGASQSQPVFLRLRIGNSDNVNTCRASTQATDYSDYLTIPIGPTQSGDQVFSLDLDLCIGNLFIGKQIPIDAFFTTLTDVTLDWNDVLGMRGMLVVYLEHGVQ
jgi:hypothetical protein